MKSVRCITSVENVKSELKNLEYSGGYENK